MNEESNKPTRIVKTSNDFSIVYANSFKLTTSKSEGLLTAQIREPYYDEEGNMAGDQITKTVQICMTLQSVLGLRQVIEGQISKNPNLKELLTDDTGVLSTD